MEVEEKIKKVPVFIKIERYKDLLEILNSLHLETVRLKNYVEIQSKIKEIEKNLLDKEKESLAKILESLSKVTKMLIGKEDKKSEELEILKEKLNEIKGSLEDVSKKLEVEKEKKEEVELKESVSENSEESVIREYRPS